MKKFLLIFSLFSISTSVFSQQSCPTNAKRNNGNSCLSGGGIEIEFASQPVANLQIAAILTSGGVSTVVEETKQLSSRAGKWFIDWCFEVDNIGPVVQGTVQYQFYIDVDGNNMQTIDPNTGLIVEGERSFLCSQATLPVTLANFDAVQKSGKVSLTWNTILELNNDGFEIERRIGNGTYQRIAFVDSKAPGGNGAAYSYSFDDNTALPKGVTYYRLKQVDFDGRATYSEIRAVRSANGTLLLSVYPNPSRGTTNVAIPAGIGAVDVTLTDFTGKSLQQWNGLNTSNLQLTNLKPGMYTLRVSVRATGETITERISVQ